MARVTTAAPRCLIVDEHPVVRAGVRAVLEAAWKDPDVIDAATVEEAAAALNGTAPDVVIVDPWRAGVELQEMVARLEEQLGAPVVIFTSDGGARLLSEALKAG